MMNDKTAGIRWLRPGVVLAVLAAAAGMALGSSVRSYTSYPEGPAGSATYRQVTAFAQCMRGHGAPDFQAPPPGGSFSVTGTAGNSDAHPAQAVDSCKHLLPRGRETTKIVIG